MAKDEGLSLGYRLGWNIRKVVLSVLGPAQLGDNDPLERLRNERREKAAEARAKKGSGS